MATVRRPVLSLEISPLGEREHTGIANVAKALAREMLHDETIDARFFMQRSDVPRGVVERLVSMDSGEILWWLAGRLDAGPSIDLDRRHVGIFTSTKKHRRLFPTEVLIVHDLTTVILPEFHDPETVKFWSQQLLGDMLSSDLIVAVSESTKMDIRTYFPQVDQIPCIVSHLAPSVSRVAKAPVPASPYVLVLGTLEPRKNVQVVLDCLSRNPKLAEEAQFVFVGRWGWGDNARALIETHGLSDMVQSGRILFTGFVSDEARDALLANARFVVYPSKYEGFGLPVIEALHFGTPVLTSSLSSLPEVGGREADYCDFDDPAAVLDAFATMLARDPTAGKRKRKQAAARFTWSKTYQRIKNAALAQAAPSS